MTTTDMTGDMGADDKWAKNGFGENIPRSTAGGKFTKEESELVRAAVQQFCAVKDLPVARLCSECEHKAELKGAWMEISKVLPHRSVQSVYRHGLRILHPFKRGAWTEEDVEKLIELVARHGKKWIAVQKILHRSADSCRDKYREMADGNFVKGRWKEQETEQLTKLIRQHLRLDPNASIVEIGEYCERESISIPWSTISKEMGHRSRLSCFKKYQKMTGTFSPSDEVKRAKQQQQRPDPPQTGPLAGHESADDELTMPSGATASIRQQRASAFSEMEEHHEHPEASSGDADVDMYLLSELAESGIIRASEVSWETLPVDDAQKRWNQLIMEWQRQEGDEVTEDLFLTLACHELAQLLLDRKTSAKMAAETVEAVDLPTV